MSTKRPGRRRFLKQGAAALAGMAVTGIPSVSGKSLGSEAPKVHAAASKVADTAPVSLRGGQEQTGPYDVDPNWPKPLSSLPGQEKWTWGACEGIFAENPNRVYVAMRGELPLLERPKDTPVPQFGPSLSFPVYGVQFRNATVGPVASAPDKEGKAGIDYRWQYCLFVVDSQGNIRENWSQWDSLLQLPHAVYVNPYDPEKHVWVVDDHRCQIFKFTHDGKKLVMTLGTKDQPGDDATHFNHPAFLAWLPDSTMFVADGSVGHRVAKFDKNGKFLLSWGKQGVAGKETRPGYFNQVHGIAVDPVTRRVYVNDRNNHRIQVFDENGKFLDMWKTGDPPSRIFSIFISADRHLWATDAGISKVVQWDLNGKYLYSWGYQGEAPGALWGPHQFSVDQQGNLYVAEVSNGRVQRFRPKPGADPARLVGKPFYAAWKE